MVVNINLNEEAWERGRQGGGGGPTGSWFSSRKAEVLLTLRSGDKSVVSRMEAST